MTTMTAQNIITATQALLKDSGTATPKFDVTTEILPFVGPAEMAVIRERPDSLIAESGTLRSATPILSATQVMTLDDKWKLACAHFVCQHAYGMEAGDNFDATRAGMHAEMFRIEVAR